MIGMTRSPAVVLRGALVALCAIDVVGAAPAADRVRLIDRKELLGDVVAVSPGDVEIRDARTGDLTRVTIDRVASVEFAGEPPGLRAARTLFLAGDFAGALEALDTIEQVELDGASDVVLADVAFLRAATVARRAADGGEGLEAGMEDLRAFLAAHSRSHHVLAAQEILGDLFVQAGRYPEAAAAYAALAQGPPAFRVRAGIAAAESLVAQRRYADAEREFATAAAIRTDPDDAASAGQKRDAEVGRARCLARQDRWADAVGLLGGLVRAADPGDGEFLGRAYAALGDAHRAAGRDRDALVAYLTVDLVYNTSPETHAEALYNLVQLWEKVLRPERARAARQALESAYPESRWVREPAAAAGSG